MRGTRVTQRMGVGQRSEVGDFRGMYFTDAPSRSAFELLMLPFVESGTFNIPSWSPNSWVKVNAGQFGYFRVCFKETSYDLLMLHLFPVFSWRMQDVKKKLTFKLSRVFLE